jgi:hypothetical protein
MAWNQLPLPNKGNHHYQREGPATEVAGPFCLFGDFLVFDAVWL